MDFLLMDFQFMDFQLIDYIVYRLQLLMDFQFMDFQFMEYLLMKVIVDRVHVDGFDWVLHSHFTSAHLQSFKLMQWCKNS